MSLERKIHRRLGKWLEEGLITSEQAEAIRRYEHENSGSTLLFWLMWLAGSSIVLGIIALIAANWEYIPAAVKLIVYFAAYAAAIFALVRVFADKPIVQEVLRLALMGYTMAGIGLVAQIFHLHSAPYRGIAFWCVLTFSLALLCQTPLGAFGWLSMAFAAFCLFVNDQLYSKDVMGYIYIALIGCLGILGSRPQRYPLFRHFQTASFLLATFLSFIYSFSLWLSLAPSPSVTAALALGVMAWALAIFTNKDLDRVTSGGFVIFLGFLLLQALTLMGHDLRDTGIGLKALSTLECALGIIALAIAAFSFGKRSIFEILIVFVFLRLLILYSELMRTFLMGGFGFIVFGLLIFAAIYVWKKFRGEIFKKLEAKIDAKK